MTNKNYREQIEHCFASHVVNPEQVDGMDNIRTSCTVLGGVIDARCPDGREKSLALTKLEEVMFWADAAIARAKNDQ